ncbi:MAG TPA: ROK family protein [Acidothermaceae bacterium]
MSTPSGATQDEIRRRNVSTLLRQVHVQGQLSRAQLTTRMGLNRSTIKALVGDLCDAGLVVETIPENGLRAGRPSHLVGPRSDTAYVLAANIGVDTVTVAAVGLGGVINARSEYRLPGPGVDYDLVIERLADELRRLQKSVKPGGWLAGVGVGVPGAVRQADGFVEFAPNLGWRGVPFGDRLSQRLALPVRTSVGNDGDLGGLAEHVRGAGRGIGHLIYLASEVGIGGGIVVDGRILTGAHGYGGELGHMMVNPDGRLCRCGSRGCFETEAGEDAVLVACGRTAGGGRAALMEVFAAASHGEKRALDGLQSIALWVARGLTSLVNILNPDVVILGGPLSSLFFLTGDRIKSEMDAMSTFAGRAQVRLLQPGLGEDSSLLGAAELAFEPLLDDPVDAWSRRAS